MHFYDFSIDVAQKAGQLLLEYREQGFETATKGGNVRDVVTSADKYVNEFLVQKIRAAFPEHRIYSEEGAEGAEESEYLWVIDPIDGSSNFSRGIPHYAVSIGLLTNGVPEVGAVYNPVTCELFSFKKGGGAFLNGTPIRVSDVPTLARAQVIFSPGSRRPELWDWASASYRKLLEHSFKRGMYGSSALDLCYVACGRADAGVYGTLSTLDIAGALGILTEAGGSALSSSGGPVLLRPESQKVYFGNGPELAEEVRILLES
jgi:myo-inositol-1(or 4)-monophosphatase